MNGNQAILKDLRDIHLPEPISMWPPAGGWWMAAVVLVLLIAGIVYWYVRRRSSKRLQKTALSELKQLQQTYLDTGQQQRFIAGLSILLRRVALSSFDRRRVAGMTGEAWLMFLDESSATNHFTKGMGRVLTSGPYQREVNIDADQLVFAAQHWIKKNT